MESVKPYTRNEGDSHEADPAVWCMHMFKFHIKVTIPFDHRCIIYIKTKRIIIKDSAYFESHDNQKTEQRKKRKS